MKKTLRSHTHTHSHRKSVHKMYFHWLREYVFVCVRMRHLCTDESSILYAFRVKISFNIARIEVSFAHLILLLCFMHFCRFSVQKKIRTHNNNKNSNNKDNNQQQPIFVISHSKRNDSYLEYHSQLNVSLSNIHEQSVWSKKSVQQKIT